MFVTRTGNNSLARSDQVSGEKGALEYKCSSTLRFGTCSSVFMSLIQIPALGSRVSLAGTQSAWLDLISYPSSFLCHSAHVLMLFRVCSPVPLKTIFTAMKSKNIFSKAFGKSTWQNMHHCLLLGQNLCLGHCSCWEPSSSFPAAHR